MVQILSLPSVNLVSLKRLMVASAKKTGCENLPKRGDSGAQRGNQRSKFPLWEAPGAGRWNWVLGTSVEPS